MKSTALLVTLAADDGETSVHEVTVLNPDRLRAEQMAHRLRLPGLKEAPLSHMTLWAWAACVRTGLTAAKAETFLNEVCLDVDKAPGEALDPTTASPDTDSP